LGRLCERRASTVPHSARIVSPAKTGLSTLSSMCKKGKAGMLHRRLDQQALGTGIDERRRRQASLDIGFVGKLVMSASVTVRP
jgi:hypothetical protein